MLWGTLRQRSTNCSTIVLEPLWQAEVEGYAQIRSSCTEMAGNMSRKQMAQPCLRNALPGA